MSQSCECQCVNVPACTHSCAKLKITHNCVDCKFGLSCKKRLGFKKSQHDAITLMKRSVCLKGPKGTQS